MQWILAKKRLLKHLDSFVIHDEWKHVSLSHRYKQRERGLKAIIGLNNTHSAYPDNPLNSSPLSYIRAMFLYSQLGILFPKFENISEDQIAGVQPILLSVAKNLFSVIGLEREVTCTCKMLPKAPHTVVNYYLMVLFRENYNEDNKNHHLNSMEENTPPGLSVKRARPSDASLLFPLQEAYELEEVVLDKKNYNRKFSFINFKRSLSANIILYASLNGKPVAKAGTNARGYITDQIGGVFTEKEARGNGFAGIVMKKLLFCIFREKQAASLFVKKSNIPAIKLYKKLGFEIIDSFQIAYF